MDHQYSFEVLNQFIIVDEFLIRSIDRYIDDYKKRLPIESDVKRISKVVLENNEVMNHFNEDILTSLHATTKQITSLELTYKINKIEIMKFSFRDNGAIFANCISKDSALLYYAKEIENNLKAQNKIINPLYRWICNESKRGMLVSIGTMLTFLSFVFLVFSTYSYFHAKDVGVNIPNKFLIPGNEIYREISAAIQSDDLSYKVNTLLKFNLRGFINADSFISDALRDINVSARIFIGSFFSVLLLRVGGRYSRSIEYNFGQSGKNIDANAKLMSKGIIVFVFGMIINIFSSIFV